MIHPATILPPRRPELKIGPLGERGETVVKDPLAGGYYHLGAPEAFLLSRLDGRQTADEACVAYRERFGEAISALARAAAWRPCPKVLTRPGGPGFG